MQQNTPPRYSRGENHCPFYLQDMNSPLTKIFFHPPFFVKSVRWLWGSEGRQHTEQMGAELLQISYTAWGQVLRSAEHIYLLTPEASCKWLFGYTFIS